ncbi:hypothetical protein AB4156_37010 [Cupriavidus sp. 2MCAB6]|uniref:hypothetical protein n=1 Tax=Cupriavidus sp. 2MCAB6 TaxID=3232981 RepID=UPI003F93E6F3
MARQTSCKVELDWIEPGNRPGGKRPPRGALLFLRKGMANGWKWLRLMLWQSPIHNIFILELKKYNKLKKRIYNQIELGLLSIKNHLHQHKFKSSL